MAVFIVACAPGKDFEQGVLNLNEINSKYGTTMETYPDTVEKMSAMIDEMSKLKSSGLNAGSKPFSYVLNYRILNLEAEKLYSESQKYGTVGSTASGFSCKPRPLILESADLRQKSALKAFEAVDVIRKIVNEYPKEASSLGFSEKNALFLNATFYEIEKQAKKDISLMNNLCTENKTLEFYRQEFKSKKLMSNEEIEKITYSDAVIAWKKERGYN